MRSHVAGFVLAGLVLVMTWEPVRASDADLALANRLGHVVLMRHAEAPGMGDPSGFRADDCATQRNLDQRGRDQALAIGAKFARAGIKFTRVLTSAWCRCKETAALVAGFEPAIFPALNSFVSNIERGPSQAARVRQEMTAVEGFEPVLMVTHQVMITELTGIMPVSGEVIIVNTEAGSNGRLKVVARLKPE